MEKINSKVLTGENAVELNAFDRFVEAERYFTGTKYQAHTDHAARLLLAGDVVKADEYMKKTLPTAEKLFEELLGKLDGKPVAKTLAKIEAKKTENNFQNLKGFSSLLTHICVECDKGNMEFCMLFPYVYERISELIFEVSASQRRGVDK